MNSNSNPNEDATSDGMNFIITNETNDDDVDNNIQDSLPEAYSNYTSLKLESTVLDAHEIKIA